MAGKIRQEIIEQLWRDYSRSSSHVKQIESRMREKQISLPRLDHFAIIDLPGKHTGISELSRLFAALGYQFQGKGYLPEKQNDFTWMADAESRDLPALNALPQVVVADFRLDEMHGKVKDIICKYSNTAPPSPVKIIETLARQNDTRSNEELFSLITHYLSGRDWPLPTVSEFQTVREQNELLAWVLVFGRRPNHFTYSVHLMPEFNSLMEFHHFIESEVGLALNHDGGVVKGAVYSGIQQGSTAGTPVHIQLADGMVELPTGFVEFVWRFSEKKQPVLWSDYFSGFIANHANRVIQSLYVND